MYIFNLVQKLIFNKPLLHLILIIQLFAGFFVIECAISTLTLTTGATDFINPLLKTDFCYFSVAERNHQISAIGEAVDETIFFEDCLNNLCATMQNDCLGLSVANKSATMQLQPKELIKNTHPNLYKGTNHFQGEREENVIRILTDDKTFKLNSYYDGFITTLDGKDQRIKIKIIGIIEKPAYCLSTSTAGSEMASVNIAHLLETYSYRDNIFNCIGCLEDYENIIGQQIKHPINKNTILLFDKNISKKVFDENVEFLKSKGVVATADDIINATKASDKFVIQKHLPTFIFLFTVTITGIVAISTINISQQIKTLSIYNMLGCTYKDIAKIIYFYIFAICIAAFVLIWGVLSASQIFGFLSDYFFRISLINYITPIIISTFICFIIPRFPLNCFKRQNSTEIRRKL